MSQVITGKIISIGNEERVSEKFTKREFVIETDGKFPKKICFQLTNANVDIIDPYAYNETVEVYYNPESKEFKGRWFTNLTAWKIQKQAYNQDSHYEPDEPNF